MHTEHARFACGIAGSACPRPNRAAFGRTGAQSTDPGTYPPNTIRPIRSPRARTSSGSVAARNFSARSKNSLSFRLSASLPFSMCSRRIRLALSRRVFAILRTFVARCLGRLTLCRTASITLTEPLCIGLNQDGPGSARAGCRAHSVLSGVEDAARQTRAARCLFISFGT